MSSPVRDPGNTPGESEMSWGPGPMPDPTREDPDPFDDLKAAFDVNKHSDDPAAQETYRYPYPNQ